MSDAVSHPAHYTRHASGVECIEVTRWLSFNRGNAFKYLFRHRDKGAALQDLQKALWYVQDEIVHGDRFAASVRATVPALKIADATSDGGEAGCYLLIAGGSKNDLRAVAAWLRAKIRSMSP